MQSKQIARNSYYFSFPLESFIMLTEVFKNLNLITFMAYLLISFLFFLFLQKEEFLPLDHNPSMFKAGYYLHSNW